MLELANLTTCIRENIDMQPHSFNQIVKEVVDKGSVQADSKNIVLNFEACEGNDLVICCARQISILFSILLDNAINYSNNGSIVNIIT